MVSSEDRDQLARAVAVLPLPDLLDVVEATLTGALIVEVWLWDYQRRSIVEVRSGRSLDTSDLDAELGSAGASRSLRLHGEELGYLAVRGVDGARAAEVADAIADLMAAGVRASEATSDAVAARRRIKAMSLPAEMQWRILPPSQFEIGGVSLSAAVEPAYDTGGDIYDYALMGQKLFLAVLDARGHGLRAATTATVAASAMRRARRNGADLETIAGEIGISIGAVGVDHEFISAVLMELDLQTGAGRWLSAGHLPPLVVGDDAVELDLEPALPLGMVLQGRQSEPVPQTFEIRPGQSVVLYSDGIIENAADDDGLAVGEDRFHRALLDNLTRRDTGHVARAVVEDLLTITGPRLRDDATLMIVTRPTD